LSGLTIASTGSAGAAPAKTSTAAPAKTDIIFFQGLDFFPPNRPAQVVDLYIAQDGAVVNEIPDVYQGDAIDIDRAFPGFVKPGFFVVDVVKHLGNPNTPLLVTAFTLKAGQSKTVATYFSATPTGKKGAPTISVFNNDVGPTNGQARLTIYHLAVAPTVGVYADGSTPLVASSSNGMSATAQVPSATYAVTVNALNDPGDVLFNVGKVHLSPNTLTEAFAYGFYPSSFGVATISVRTNS
jgi:hypothetical protein